MSFWLGLIGKLIKEWFTEMKTRVLDLNYVLIKLEKSSGNSGETLSDS